MTTYGYYDVVIAGGGPAGVTAALAAARQNVSVLITEQLGFLGGLAASGLPLLSFHTVSGNQICKGIAQEIVDRLQEIGGTPGHIAGSEDSHVGTMTPIYPEEFKFFIEQMLIESKVDILLHTKIVGAETENGRVSELILAMKEGLAKVSAGCIVDATGDADVLAFAGGAFDIGRKSDCKAQSMTTLFNVANVDEEKARKLFNKEVFYAKRPGEKIESLMHIHGGLGRWKELSGKHYPFTDPDHGLWAMILRKGQLNLNIVDIIGKDALTSKGLTEAEIEGRRQIFAMHTFLKKYVPGFEYSYINFSHCVVGVRETRRIRGLYQLKKDDVIRCSRFDDVIARAAYSIDLHGPEGEGIKFEMQQSRDEAYDIPYRCLVPEKLDGLLVAGRSISSEHEALASCRVMVFCMGMGEAAGTAAAMSVKLKRNPRDLNVGSIQDRLVKTGALL